MSDNMYDVEHLFVHMSFTTSVVISYHKNKGEKVRSIDFQKLKLASKTTREKPSWTTTPNVSLLVKSIFLQLTIIHCKWKL